MLRFWRALLIFGYTWALATVTDPNVDAVSTSNVTSYGNTEFAPDLAFTPAVDDLIVVGIATSGSVEPTAAGALTDDRSGTYTLAGTANRSGNASTIYIFVRDQAVTSAVLHTLTFTCTGDAATGACAIPLRIAGMSKFGAAAIKQFKATSGIAAGGTPAVTFDAACDTNNPTILVLGTAANPPAVTPPTNWTEAGDAGVNTPAQGIEVAYRASGHTTGAITYGSTSSGASGLAAVELDASSNEIAPAAQTLTLAAVAPSVQAQVSPGAQTLALGQPAPSVQGTLAPAAQGLTLGAPAPAVTFNGVTAPAVALTLGQPAPTLQGQIAVGAQALTLGQPSPSIQGQVAPAAQGLSLGAVAPQVQPQINPSAQGLVLGAVAPSVQGRVTPGAAPLSLGAPAPNIQATGADPTISPAAQVLSLGALSPAVQAQITPAALGLTLGAVAPMLSAQVAPGPSGLSLGALAPQVAGQIPIGAQALSLGAPPPDVKAQLMPPVLPLVLGAPPPTITIEQPGEPVPGPTRLGGSGGNALVGAGGNRMSGAGGNQLGG